MTCCTPGAEAALVGEPDALEQDEAALLLLSRRLPDGARQLEFAVPDAHCAACIRSIETELAALPQVANARVNLSRRRVRVVFDPAQGPVTELSTAIRRSGYHNYVLDQADDQSGDPVLRELVRALAVAGFAAGNIMLFSVSVWAGADQVTRDLFHWLSALIAVPAVAYSGRVFFRSAFRALRVGRTNMDVPISIGVILATALSIFETLNSGPHAYFDASTMLLFFLLAGRTLDHLMRERARSAITNLARLAPRGATQLHPDGRREYLSLAEIAPDMLLEIRPGERVPVDAIVESPHGSFDTAIVTGESAPRALVTGEKVMAGANCLGSPVIVRAVARAEDSFLSRMVALMEAAEGARTRHRRIADRAAAVYAPIVHTLAAATFLGWGLLGGNWHVALLNAVAVLIITCPCALALAVPIVHVVAAGRLFERGILMRDGAALERAAEVDRVALDKTGTLTLGAPRLVRHWVGDPEALRIAGALAETSLHPLSRAVADLAGHAPSLPVADRRELPGLGIEGRIDGATWRLGSATWCGLAEAGDSGETEVWLSCDGVARASFGFADSLRTDAAETIARLGSLGLPVQLISGDLPRPVEAAAWAAGIDHFQAQMLPEEKLAVVSQGRTLMVGDGVNDAPALMAAHVSMAPADAADIGRNAADFIFTGGRLGAVPFVVDTARRAAAMVNENLLFAVGYNAVAVPLAVTGMVTPLIAAVAMSASSVVVVLNALRLRLDTPADKRASAPLTTEARV